MVLSHAQQVALALAPKFSSALSIIGSSWIIFEVLRDKKKQSMVYHRLLLGLSVLDVLISSAWFMSTWPVPSDVQGLYGNLGNQATCLAQGFFIQLKGGNPFYNSFLAIYFVLVVKFGWSEKKIRLWEPYMHGSSIMMAVGTASASLALGLFGNANLWCWIEGQYPLYRMVFFYIWYWASLVIVTASMGIVYWTVRSAEVGSEAFSASGKKNTRKVGTQALLYISAYYLTALFATITRVWQAFSDDVPFWAKLCMTIFYPSQGLMNAIIYLRPRYMQYRKKYPTWSLGTTAKECLRRAFSSGKVDDDYKLGTASEDTTLTTMDRETVDGLSADFDDIPAAEKA